MIFKKNKVPCTRTGKRKIHFHTVPKNICYFFFRIGYSVFDLNLHNWRVYAGEYNINTQDPYEKTYHIRRVLLHPGYNTTSLENDIALIITVEPIM